MEANTADGLRKCLAEEFSSLYIFHLRGNQRTSGERSRKEGGKIFGSGSRAPIAVSILVKNPEAEKCGQIYFHDIGDYLTREQKLETIAELGSINGIAERQGWQEIIPDEFNDWLNQRDPNFDNYISLGDKKDKDALVVFENYSNGVKTNRDAWVYNYSIAELERNMKNTIGFYNLEVDKINLQYPNQEKNIDLTGVVDTDDTKISWTVNLQNDLKRRKKSEYKNDYIMNALYRPFTKQHLYFDKQWIERTLQIPKIFPNFQVANQVISVTGRGSTKEFSALISNEIPDLEMISKGQCFPLDVYEFSDGVETAERT
ncbi:type ISP restriction/modification enzyme, partial [Neisseria polysaccharea]|uniref:type ISP restriction/modification enzyme n=1 Tax=Neisseria polysaccharea TaxID=489 RepID=UPI00398A4660